MSVHICKLSKSKPCYKVKVYTTSKGTKTITTKLLLIISRKLSRNKFQSVTLGSQGLFSILSLPVFKLNFEHRARTTPKTFSTK